MKKHFFIFRHGQTTYNSNGFIQGQTNNSVLTEIGISQAYEIGLKLKKYPIEVMLCSPLARTIQTANEVLKNLTNIPIIKENGFIEVNVGEIEGLHYKEVLDKYGSKYQKWRDINDTDLDFCFKGGETKAQVRKRAKETIDRYLHKTDYNYIAVSTHGILLAQICNELGYKVDEIKNGAILHLFFDDGSIKIDFI